LNASGIILTVDLNL